MQSKCSWATKSKLLQQYHDNEWGRPVYNSEQLFEMLMLEILSSGLSWEIILKKRDDLRELFHNFSPSIISKYTETDVNQLICNPKVIRHRSKITAIINNANAYIALSKTISFSDFIWDFFNYKPSINYDIQTDQYNIITNLICNKLRQYKFTFIGSTVIYSFFQAAGIINDHDTTCPRKFCL